jgi:tetratricopeptide (TPR) repeat protein/tRNA A-37 threonylcarbamoyl transferase component Bud32
MRADRIRDIFVEAMDIAPEARAGFLDEACGGDVDLRAEVERLIQNDAATPHVLAFARKLAPERGRFAEGTVLAGRFRIVRFVAAGGMGDVYEAEDVELRSRVALKTIQSESIADSRALERFKREIQYAKRVTHPNVCRIYDLGSHRDGAAETFFLTMELIEGRTLAERLRERGPMAPEEALPLISQMASALSAAHQAGIVHRDFKPSNVILAKNESGPKAIVSDFGLARSSSAEEDASLTDTGRLVGTPAYMSPEQLTGGAITPATDIYALGLVIYEMLTGQKAFPGNTTAAALKRLAEPAPSLSKRLPGLDPRWSDTVAKCLELQPERRFKTALEVAGVLTPGAAPTQTLTGVRIRHVFRSRITKAAIGTAVAAAVLVGGAKLMSKHRASSEAMRWYEEGTRSLRDGTSFTAMTALERAVKLDPDFALAHARLAEAAGDLDYSDKAKSEMLRASPPAFESFFLRTEEKLRLQAVYFLLVKDFPHAIEKYKELASKVDESEHAAVLVDLGRAYESAGQAQDALKSYSESIARDKQYAAAFLRRAVLEGRQQMSEKASADFDAADQLYRAEGRAEGMIEVLYQRAVLLRRTGRLAEARGPAQAAFEMAKASGDEYHQIRGKLELSYLAYSSGDVEGGKRQAEEASDFARRAGIEVLAQTGLVDIANALFNRGDYDASERYLNQALEMARRFQSIRVQARAQLTLASVLLKKGRTDDALNVSKQALENYLKAGDRNNAARAAIPVARSLREQGDYEGALKLFQQQLENAEQVKDPLGIAYAAQGLGATLFIQERFPEALPFLDRAAAAANSISDRTTEGYSLQNRAEVLWHLGRFREAEESLKSAETLAGNANASKPLISRIHFTRAGMNLARGDYEAVEQNAKSMLEAANDSASQSSAKRLIGLALARSGKVKAGRESCEESLRLAGTIRDVSLTKNVELALAEVQLTQGERAPAGKKANKLASYFAERHLPESHLLARFVAASSAGEPEREQLVAAVERQIAELRSSWGAENSSAFFARPDIFKKLQRLGLQAASH